MSALAHSAPSVNQERAPAAALAVANAQAWLRVRRTAYVALEVCKALAEDCDALPEPKRAPVKMLVDAVRLSAQAQTRGEPALELAWDRVVAVVIELVLEMERA